MGLSPLLEGEEGDAILSSEDGDRPDIGLPASQREYIKQLVLHGARVVLVLTGGSPIALGEIADMVDAIVFIWYPGQEGGRAVADVLFGRAVPSGRLPLTFPQSLDQLPPFENYAMTGRTYRYATWAPLYPFGFGLSYTQFSYGDLALPKGPAVRAGEGLPVRFAVTNTGNAAAEEVSQLYLSDLEASVEVPIQGLIGFGRVRLAPGERAEIAFTVTPEMMMLVDDAGRTRLEPGRFRLTVGGCSPGPRGATLGAAAPVSAVFEVSA